MAILIDLSAKELRPDAVARFIRDHVENPGPKQILFKVDGEAFKLFQKSGEPGFAVSRTEADEINKFVGKSLPPEEYTINRQQSCTQCGRTLTFYDVFQTERKHHGDDYVRRFIVGGAYHIQVHEKDPTLDVECTSCGTANKIIALCYSCSDYTYA